MRYAQAIIDKARLLRSQAKTYSEIKKELEISIPKSTLSDWCSKVELPKEYNKKIEEIIKISSHKGRTTALIVNKLKRDKLFEEIKNINLPIALAIHNKNTARIALAMLCLGEASKSANGASSFYFGNSDPRIIYLFLHLLEFCFSSFSLEKVRCTVQCRADQSVSHLERYWVEKTGIPKRLFYKAQIDPRTVGKPTKKADYKGVLRVDYFDNKVWFELESLADLVYNQLSNGPVA